MTPTLAATRQALYDLLLPLENASGINAVYDNECSQEASGPCWVTVAFERTTPTEQVWAVRVYSQIADSVDDATTTLYSAIDAVDGVLGAAAYGPSAWQAGLVDELGALVARWFVDVPRATF